MDMLKRVFFITLVVVLGMSSIGWGRVVKCETAAAPLADPFELLAPDPRSASRSS